MILEAIGFIVAYFLLMESTNNMNQESSNTILVGMSVMLFMITVVYFLYEVLK